MSPAPRPALRERWRVLLAAMAAVLVGLLGAGTASAATLPGLETRVGASNPVTAYVVGVHETVSAGQRWGHAPPTAQIASATGVAAKAGMSVAEAESWAAARAAQLQAQLPAGSAGRVTMGAGVVRDGSGNLIRVVSTSEPNGYLRAGVTLEPGEVLVRGAGHAEADIVKWAADNGYEVVTIGAGRPICPACAGSISGSGGSAATPLKVP